MKRKLIVLSAVFTILIVINITPHLLDINTNSFVAEDIIQEEWNNKEPKNSDSWDNFSYIHIKGNWSTAVSLGWCKGDGSWDNPYIIENMTIDGNTSTTGCGIFIEDSKNDYFQIKNCTIINNNNTGEILNPKGGIKFKNTNNGTIIDCNLSNNSRAIVLMGGKNCTIKDNEIINCEQGIIITGNFDTFAGCVNISIKNNNITKSDLGIQIVAQLWENYNVSLSDNRMEECGVFLGGTNNELASHTIDTTNTVNKKPIYYYVNRSNLIPNNFVEAGQVIMFYCNNSIIENINTSYTSYGFELNYCINLTISLCNISNNKFSGIYLSNSNNLTIKNSDFSFNEDNGIFLYESNYNKIFYNNFTTNQIGINLDSSINNNISGNIIKNCGVILSGQNQEDFSNNIDISNYVNDNPIYYYKNKNSLKQSNFSDAGQIILVNCNNSIVSNQNTSNCTQGITLFYCYNNSIENNNASFNSKNGIYIYKSINITLFSNNCSFNIENGLYLYWSNLGNISFNTVRKNEYGLNLDTCNSYIINHNNLTFNFNNGINFKSCSNNSINYNHIINNEIYGIYLDNSHYINITNSLLKFNIEYGIYLVSCGDCITMKNNITDNFKYGVYISDTLSSDNYFFNNTFKNNLFKNAFESGIKNYWNNSFIGNFWDDYIGKDSDDDGIGDQIYPYNIFGGSNQDKLPIYWDAPVILYIGPANNSLIGVESPTVTTSIIEGVSEWFWYTFNTNPTKYNFSEPFDKLNQTAWNDLNNGTHIIHFFVNDSHGYITTIDLILRKDSLNPIINIETPSTNQPCGNISPDFQIEIIEPHIHSIWYRLYNTTEYTINYSCSYSGKINQTAWERMWNYITEGSPITIIFYANDTVGNFGSFNVTVLKYIPSGDTSGDDGGGGGKSKDSEDSNLFDFLTSPIGVAIVGGSAAATVGVVIMILKKRAYTSKEKEKERIDNFRGV